MVDPPTGVGLLNHRATAQVEIRPSNSTIRVELIVSVRRNRIAEEKLRRDLPIITTEHAAGELEEKGFTDAIALDTWDSVFVTKGDHRLRITSMPGQHGPGIVDFALPPVMGSMSPYGLPGVK